jgi:hypothetical protein
LKRGPDPIGDKGNNGLAPDHLWTNAVNGNIHVVEIILRVDQRRPRFREFAISEGCQTDLADGAHVGIGGFDVDGSEPHRA